MERDNDKASAELLDRALNAIFHKALPVPIGRDQQARMNRQRWFGVSLLILATFCLAVAAAPWPGRGLFDFLTWVVFSAVLMIVGAWQIDRAAATEISSTQESKKAKPPATPAPATGKIRRIK